jgi:hypothetical protein
MCVHIPCEHGCNRSETLVTSQDYGDGFQPCVLQLGNFSCSRARHREVNSRGLSASSISSSSSSSKGPESAVFVWELEHVSRCAVHTTSAGQWAQRAGRLSEVLAAITRTKELCAYLYHLIERTAFATTLLAQTRTRCRVLRQQQQQQHHHHGTGSIKNSATGVAHEDENEAEELEQREEEGDEGEDESPRGGSSAGLFAQAHAVRLSFPREAVQATSKSQRHRSGSSNRKGHLQENSDMRGVTPAGMDDVGLDPEAETAGSDPTSLFASVDIEQSKHVLCTWSSAAADSFIGEFVLPVGLQVDHALR